MVTNKIKSNDIKNNICNDSDSFKTRLKKELKAYLENPQNNEKWKISLDALDKRLSKDYYTEKFDYYSKIVDAYLALNSSEAKYLNKEECDLVRRVWVEFWNDSRYGISEDAVNYIKNELNIEERVVFWVNFLDSQAAAIMQIYDCGWEKSYKIMSSDRAWHSYPKTMLEIGPHLLQWCPLKEFLNHATSFWTFFENYIDWADFNLNYNYVYRPFLCDKAPKLEDLINVPPGNKEPFKAYRNYILSSEKFICNVEWQRGFLANEGIEIDPAKIIHDKYVDRYDVLKAVLEKQKKKKVKK